MNKKILIAGLFTFVMLLVPINSAYSNNGLLAKNIEENLLYTTMLDDTWVKTYDKNDNDYGNSVQQTSDGGYIVVARALYPTTSVEYDWIFKTDNNGNIIWQKMYSEGPDTYSANSVIETNDNKYVITGKVDYDDGYDNYRKLWLLKLDADGTQIWSKIFNFSRGGHEVIQTSDGGYVIVGYDGYYDICLLKTYSNGSINWVKTYDNDELIDFGYSLKQTSDGGFIMVGYSYINVNPIKTWLLKTDENGTLLWDKNFSGKGESQGYSVDIADDGGYIITGSTRTDPDDFDDDDLWLLKTDENGTLLWEKTFGNPNYHDESSSVIATYDGGCVVAGDIYVSFGNTDAILIKTDNLGNKIWSKTYGGSFYDGANSVQLTTDGGYILTGAYQPRFGLLLFRRQDVFLIKTDSNGNAPPLSKTKAIGFRNRVFDSSFLTLLLDRFPLLHRLLNIWRYNLV